MGSVSPKVLVAFSLWAIAALYCLPARAQETTTQDRQAAAEFDFFQQPAYQKVMTDCAYKAVTPPDFPSGQRVTPAMFKITPDKFQIIRNCMDEKGFPVPDGQKYARKGSDIQNAVPQAAQQSPPADVPQVTLPAAQDGAGSPPSAVPQPINNTPHAGGNDNNEGNHLWVAPRSQ